MHTIVFRGVEGEVKWAYHHAASLRNWTITPDAAGPTLTASVVSSDAFKVSQQPLTFVVPRPTGHWKWPITSLQIDGSALKATLGPQQE